MDGIHAGHRVHKTHVPAFDLVMGEMRFVEYAPDAFALMNTKTGERFEMNTFPAALKVYELLHFVLKDENIWRN